MTDFGKGPVLKDASPWLRDVADRIEHILAVTETDSVIEGLPPFQEETRDRIRQHLTTHSAPVPMPEK
jgi:hypothetical protein